MRFSLDSPYSLLPISPINHIQSSYFLIFSYLVRQRAAFLDGIKPPDFCEGAAEKTCDEISPSHSLPQTVSHKCQVHRNRSSAAKNHIERSGVRWSAHDVRRACACLQFVVLGVTPFAWALRSIPTLLTRKRRNFCTRAIPSCSPKHRPRFIGSFTLVTATNKSKISQKMKRGRVFILEQNFFDHQMYSNAHILLLFAFPWPSPSVFAIGIPCAGFAWCCS